mmetsp:Transcript_9737/g.39576  ORF Transcript_9737/g.39576 Transcript_9737/m.39576 type:complete len:529 (-) Transcript_9737:446-2032(-)
MVHGLVALAVNRTIRHRLLPLAHFVSAASRQVRRHLAEYVLRRVQAPRIAAVHWVLARVVVASTAVVAFVLALHARAILGTGDAVLAIARFAELVAALLSAKAHTVAGAGEAIFAKVTRPIVIASYHGDAELPHHLVVLMGGNVAVIGKAADVVSEPANYLDPLVASHVHDILPADFVVHRRNPGASDGVVAVRTHSLDGLPPEDLKLREMDVHGMRHERWVGEDEDLRVVEGNEDCDVIPAEAVHEPHLRVATLAPASVTVQQHFVRVARLALRYRLEGDQRARQRVRVACALAHDELEQVRRVLAVANRSGLGHYNLGAGGKVLEVDDDTHSLCCCHYEAVAHGQRSRDEPSVRAYENELRTRVQLQVEGHAVAAVHEAEQVLASAHVHVRPHHAVHYHHVSTERAHPFRGVCQRAIGVEGAVLHHQRHVELARRKVQTRFLLAADHVRPREAHVDVEPRDAKRVVVVPQRRRQLLVRVHVGRLLARKQRVVWVAVHRCQGVGAMEVGDHARAVAPEVRPMGAVRH